MKTKIFILIIFVMFLSRTSVGQTTKPSLPKDAREIVNLIVDSIRSNAGLHFDITNRDDVISEIRIVDKTLTSQERMELLYYVLGVGKWSENHKILFSSSVTSYLVEAATGNKDNEVRRRAAELLVEYVPDSYLKIHAATLIKAVEEGKIGDPYLPAKIGAEEAKKFYEKGGKYEEYREGAAKLGDAMAVMWFVDAYRKETNPRERAKLAKTLGYIGDAACVMALARDMRTPVMYVDRCFIKSFRVDLVDALSKIYPNESVFSQDIHMNVDIEKIYDAVEKWLEGHLGITWQEARPKPFSVLPIPTPARGSREFNVNRVFGNNPTAFSAASGGPTTQPSPAKP